MTKKRHEPAATGQYGDGGGNGDEEAARTGRYLIILARLFSRSTPALSTAIDESTAKGTKSSLAGTPILIIWDRYRPIRRRRRTDRHTVISIPVSDRRSHVSSLRRAMTDRISQQLGKFGRVGLVTSSVGGRHVRSTFVTRRRVYRH